MSLHGFNGVAGPSACVAFIASSLFGVDRERPMLRTSRAWWALLNARSLGCPKMRQDTVLLMHPSKPLDGRERPEIVSSATALGPIPSGTIRSQYLGWQPCRVPNRQSFASHLTMSSSRSALRSRPVEKYSSATLRARCMTSEYWSTIAFILVTLSDQSLRSLVSITTPIP